MGVVEHGVVRRRQDPRKRVLVAHGDSSFAVLSEPPVLDGAVQFSGTDIADPVVAEGPFRHRAGPDHGCGLRAGTLPASILDPASPEPAPPEAW